MISRNTLLWANESSVLKDVNNDSLDLAENNVDYIYDSRSVALLVACVLGLPGNVLLIAIYVQNMTTSTKVYMFALAIADSVVCVCGIVLRIPTVDFVTALIFRCISRISIVFSMFLLAFVSIERVIAVRRPHSFSTEASRAKKALIGIAVATVMYSTVKTVTNETPYKQFDWILKVCFLLICLLIMATCYMLVAATLLKILRNRVGILGQSHLPESGSSNAAAQVDPISNVDRGNRSPQPGPMTASTHAAHNYTSTVPGTTKPVQETVVHNAATTSQTKTYKNFVLLFIITIVFIACWLPQWMLIVGFSVPDEWLGLYILNSVVNPFIYGVASAMFREDARQFYRKTRVKLLALHHRACG